jgi:hypothetical protein
MKKQKRQNTEVEDEDVVAEGEDVVELDKPDPATAGQAGDIQGLSNVPQAAFESVEELVEEGQFFEAGILSGVEDAPDADEGEIKTREAPENDVPREYLDEDLERDVDVEPEKDDLLSDVDDVDRD